MDGTHWPTEWLGHRRRPVSWALAALGPAAVSLVALLPGGDVDLAVAALLLAVVVATAVTGLTRGPIWLAAAASTATFLLARTGAEAAAPDQILTVGGFALLALLVGELVVGGTRAREHAVRAELRATRVARASLAATLGLDLSALVSLVDHELRDELDAAEVSYEPDARSTCHYRIDQDGRLYHHADLVAGRRPRLPAELVSIPVRDGHRDFGQLVIVPRRPQTVEPAQLVMAAAIARVLAGALGDLQTTS